MIRAALLVALAALAIVFIVRWIAAASLGVKSATQSTKRPSPLQIAIGFVTDFFDTLGIGSFATTTTVYKLLRVIPDERIVGTLLAGHSLPVVVQAFIFLVVVRVDPVVLAALIGVSVVVLVAVDDVKCAANVSARRRMNGRAASSTSKKRHGTRSGPMPPLGAGGGPSGYGGMPPYGGTPLYGQPGACGCGGVAQ